MAGGKVTRKIQPCLGCAEPRGRPAPRQPSPFLHLFEFLHPSPPPLQHTRPVFKGVSFIPFFPPESNGPGYHPVPAPSVPAALAGGEGRLPLLPGPPKSRAFLNISLYKIFLQAAASLVSHSSGQLLYKGGKS